MQTIGIRRSTVQIGTGAVRNGFATLGRALREWMRILKTRGDLAELDNRMLSDLGISRAQADFQLHNAPWKLAERTRLRG